MTATTTTTTTPTALEIKIKKEYQDLIDPQTPNEYKLMKESMSQPGGQLVPGVVNEDGVILDGHHRYKACKELGIPFKYEIRHSEDELDEIWFIYEVNNRRRHWTPAQKAKHALRFKPYFEERAKRNMSLGGKGDKYLSPLGRVNKEIAKMADQSYETVRKYEEIDKAAKENPTSYASVLRNVDSSRISISEGYNIYRKDQKRAKTLADVKAAAEGLNLPSKVTLLNKDIRKVDEIPEIVDNSVELIITDPPYSKEAFDDGVYEGLAKFASKKLKDGGCLAFLFGRHLIFKIGKTFEIHAPNLTFGDIFAVVHEGRGDIFRPFNSVIKWKPMLVFVKGNKRLTNSLIDNIIYSQKPDKDQHEWAQSPEEAEHFIKNLTVSEDSVVCDPFLGSGTFGIPAIQLGRYFVGIEIDKKTFENAKNNLIIKESQAR